MTSAAITSWRKKVKTSRLQELTIRHVLNVMSTPMPMTTTATVVSSTRRNISALCGAGDGGAGSGEEENKFQVLILFGHGEEKMNYDDLLAVAAPLKRPPPTCVRQPRILFFENQECLRNHEDHFVLGDMVVVGDGADSVRQIVNERAAFADDWNFLPYSHIQVASFDFVEYERADNCAFDPRYYLALLRLFPNDIYTFKLPAKDVGLARYFAGRRAPSRRWMWVMLHFQGENLRTVSLQIDPARSATSLIGDDDPASIVDSAWVSWGFGISHLSQRVLFAFDTPYRVHNRRRHRPLFSVARIECCVGWQVDDTMQLNYKDITVFRHIGEHDIETEIYNLREHIERTITHARQWGFPALPSGETRWQLHVSPLGMKPEWKGGKVVESSLLIARDKEILFDFILEQTMLLAPLGLPAYIIMWILLMVDARYAIIPELERITYIQKIVRGIRSVRQRAAPPSGKQ
jgi:hypothetical protein